MLRNYDGWINTGFLRTVDLAKGISIDINGVYSKKSLQSYINDLKSFVSEFFVEYMTNDNYDVNIIASRSTV